MNKKIFIAQQGSGSTIKIFNAETGRLHRIISTGGTIVSTPVVTGSVVTVTVESGGSRMVKTFSLPNGGLKTTTVI